MPVCLIELFSIICNIGKFSKEVSPALLDCPHPAVVVSGTQASISDFFTTIHSATRIGPF